MKQKLLTTMHPEDPRAPVKGNEVDVMEGAPKGANLRHDQRGRELLSPLSVAPPIGYVQSPPLAQTIRALVRSALLAQEAEAAGYETFEESDDFDVGDDFDPGSPYEEIFEGSIQDDINRRLEAARHLDLQAAEAAQAKKAEPAKPGRKAPMAPTNDDQDDHS